MSNELQDDEIKLSDHSKKELSELSKIEEENTEFDEFKSEVRYL